MQSRPWEWSYISYIDSFSHQQPARQTVSPCKINIHRSIPLGLLFREPILFFILRPNELTERRSRTFESGAGAGPAPWSLATPGLELRSLSAEAVDMCVEALDVLRWWPP